MVTKTYLPSDLCDSNDSSDSSDNSDSCDSSDNSDSSDNTFFFTKKNFTTKLKLKLWWKSAIQIVMKLKKTQICIGPTIRIGRESWCGIF